MRLQDLQEGTRTQKNLISGEQIIYSQQKEDEIVIPSGIANLIDTSYIPIKRIQWGGLNRYYVDANWVVDQVRVIKRKLKGTLSDMAIDHGLMYEPGTPQLLFKGIIDASKRQYPKQQGANATHRWKVQRTTLGPYVLLKSVNALFQVINILALKYRMYP
jgi:hypothetical protein